PATINPAYGIGELVRRRILQQVAGNSRIQRPAEISRSRERRENHDLARQRMLLDPDGKLETRQPRHLNVGDDHVRPQPLRLTPCTRSIRATAEHLNIVLEAQQRRECPANHRLIFCQQHPDHVRTTAASFWLRTSSFAPDAFSAVSVAVTAPVPTIPPPRAAGVAMSDTAPGNPDTRPIKGSRTRSTVPLPRGDSISNVPP